MLFGAATSHEALAACLLVERRAAAKEKGETMCPQDGSSVRAVQRVQAALEAMVSRGGLRVPPYPAVAIKVQQLLSKDTYTTVDLVSAMRADAVFSATLLRLANSPFYRRGDEITSLAVAVQRVGPKELLRLAMAQALSGRVHSTGPLQGLRRRLWRQSLSCALISEKLALLEKAPGGESFLAGLLHDAGKLMVVEAIEEMRREGTQPESEAEMELAIERFHVRFGGVLAEHWQLPAIYRDVISSHHDASSALGSLTRRVVQADAVAKLLETRAEVGAADLERAGIHGSLAPSLAETIPHLPPTLSIFEGGKEARSTEPARSSRRPDGVFMVEVNGESATPWPLVRVHESALQVLAPQPVGESLLLEVTVVPGPLHCWVVVGRCERSAQSWATQLTPFGLGEKDFAKWTALRNRVKSSKAA